MRGNGDWGKKENNIVSEFNMGITVCSVCSFSSLLDGVIKDQLKIPPSVYIIDL